MTEKTEPIFHPVILYVERVDTNPSVDYGLERRKTVFDVDIPIQQVRSMIKDLEEQTKHLTPRGAIRIRFIGRIFQ